MIPRGFLCPGNLAVHEVFSVLFRNSLFIRKSQGYPILFPEAKTLLPRREVARPRKKKNVLLSIMKVLRLAAMILARVAAEKNTRNAAASNGSRKFTGY